MANTTTPITVSDLDFDNIKAALKTFLQGQADITTYDYEGSAITRVIDLLSLNTHYNAFLANASFNETFLDTAIKRASGVSRVGEFGYVARSAKSAQALVTVDVTNPTQTPISLSLDKYSAFATQINGQTFTFYTTAAYNTAQTDGMYEFANIPIYEGKLITNTFVYDGVSAPYFTIPNANVDLSTLTVTVQTSASNTYTQTFNFTDEIVGVTAQSPVYFVKENSDELYQVYFGDGIIGRALAAGNLVSMTYLVSSLDTANVSATAYTQSFSFAGSDIGGNTSIAVRTIQNSIGGAGKEDLTSIKFNAPLSLARAKRTITAEDFLSAISQKATAVQAVSVWGGEDNVPPVYGKVFISLMPYSGYVISDTVIADIQQNILKAQSGFLVTPVFVDPDYLYMTVNDVATYDPNLTSVGSDDIASYVSTTISNYFTQNLSKYKETFYFSALSRLIDNTNDSIISNQLSFSLQKRLTFPYNFPTDIDMKFAMSVVPGTLKSNVFTYSFGDQFNIASMFVDDKNGNVSVQNWATGQIISPNVGTVNYTTGEVIIKGFVITGLLGGVEDIRINLTPTNAVTDIVANKNQIIMLDDSTQNNTANIASGLTVSAVAKQS